MTHYKIDYSGLTPQQAHDQSIADIKEYLGDRRYSELTVDFREYSLSLEQFELYCSVIGVQGFVVRAWHDEIWPFG